MARKHCGSEHEFVISLEKLYLKTGNTSNKAEFKRLIKKLCTVNELPDYKIVSDTENDKVIFLKLSIGSHRNRSVV
ncbi:replication initiator protein A [Arsenophonus sp. aPb]|uniref:replication initiator protein A n=1 Tax=Arsenophonus sp. aPb TaxID=3041619 RepID=UPI0032AFAEB7